jgi:hypothetical protein
VSGAQPYAASEIFPNEYYETAHPMMISDKPSLKKAAGIVSAAFVAAILLAAPSQAQERRGGREHERERFQTQHWVFDDRYHHGHYYPSIGYCVPSLPVGNLGITFGRGRFFFHAGVWYQPGACGYVVARPPVGIIVPVLPPAYTTVWIGGTPYYYANDVYYAQGPGGYAVAAPPAPASGPAVPPQAPIAAPQAAPQPGNPPAAAPGTWYYCESSKSYYPYVSTCAEGWRSVPATPPPAR